MRFLLDSNAVIALMKGHGALLARLRRHRPEEIAMPAIVAHELFFGAYWGREATANLARVETLQFEVLDFDREDARRSGEVRAALARAGTPIGAYDVLIAGQALARDLVLVTHNTGKFSRVAGLRIEDWEGGA